VAMLQRLIRVLTEVAAALCLALDRPLVFVLSLALAIGIVAITYGCAAERRTLAAAEPSEADEGGSGPVQVQPTSGLSCRKAGSRMDTRRVVRKTGRPITNWSGWSASGTTDPPGTPPRNDTSAR
jgi:hypothetical protein